ncbi:MAG: transcriptional repressor [Desulfovibrio sp.]|jgi:Fur family ferric uptake transcriptional regulator|nr:transcriptional repressor [Desulfovibrio sp.]
MSDHQEHFQRFLDAGGFHATRQRLSAAALIFTVRGHHTLDELYDILRKNIPDIGKATLYRTLKLLTEAGLVLELHFNDRAARFEVVDPQKRHDHLICMNCGAVVEIQNRFFNTVKEQLSEEQEFVFTGHTQCLYGLCARCRGNENTTTDSAIFGRISTGGCCACNAYHE